VFVPAAAFTGLRWGELIARRRMDIDLDGATVNVHRSIAQLQGGRLAVVPPKVGERPNVTIPAVLVDGPAYVVAVA
jgi:hypothetical protein